MLRTQRMQKIAVARGFTRIGISEDGTTIWLYKSRSSSGPGDTRICIDTLTQSATTFLRVEGKILASQTFRSEDEMRAWLEQV